MVINDADDNDDDDYDYDYDYDYIDEENVTIRYDTIDFLSRSIINWEVRERKSNKSDEEAISFEWLKKLINDLTNNDEIKKSINRGSNWARARIFPVHQPEIVSP